MIGHLFESGPWKVLGIYGLTDNQINTGLQTRREVVQGRDLEL